MRMSGVADEGCNVKRAYRKGTIKAFYTRLRAAGKPEKVARCAAARELLHIAWAVVTKDQWFDPSYALQIQRT
jgi:hypothetical protein